MDTVQYEEFFKGEVLTFGCSIFSCIFASTIVSWASAYEQLKPIYTLMSILTQNISYICMDPLKFGMCVLIPVSRHLSRMLYGIIEPER